MRSPALLASVLPVLLGAQVHAGSPPRDVEELFLTETADPQEKLELQTTLGIQGERSDTREAMELSLLMELGLTDRLQVEVRTPVQWALSGEGAGRGPSGSSLEAGLLYALVSREDLGLVVSPGLELELPLSFSRASAPGLELTPSVSMAKALGAVRLHLNLALGVQLPDGEGRELELEPAVNFAVTVTRGPLVPLLELGLGWEDDEARAWVGPGLVWRAASWFQLGLGVPTRLGPGGVDEVRPTLLLTGELELAGEEEADDGSAP